MPRKKTEEVVDGIFMEPVPITLGDEVRIRYKGLLGQSGANKVYLHMGYGANEWRNIEDIPMRKLRDGSWSATVQVSDPSSLNFCFRDDAENWDNNYGRNWTYQVHDGDQLSH